jgi:oxygen-dependent protoporphyrinogen oxidase
MSPTHFPGLPEPTPETPHVVIVGGGIAGLSAAFYLERAARAAGVAVHYTLVERDERFGGKIQTDTIDGPDGTFLIEGGPDSFVAQKPWGVQLARDLGLEDQLMSANQVRHSTYVLLGGRPHPLPEGMMLIVPTRLIPFLRSPLLSLRGKLRMALDLIIPPRRDDADESLADFVGRRFGGEALDKLGEPLLAGIHSSAPERQSMLATFPRFRAMEQQHGSLIRGMRAAQRKTKDERRKTKDQLQDGGTSSMPRPASFASQSPFVTLRGGVGELVRALLGRLQGRLIAGRGVTALDYDPAAKQPYRARLDNGELLDADAVILATPAFAAAELVAPIQPDLAADLRQIRYVTTSTITLAYRRADLGGLIDGFGLLIPQSEGRRINALTVTSAKFAGRAPDSHMLLRLFVGGSRTPEVAALGDTALLALLRAELRDILGIDAAPLWGRIYRWPDASPQYDVGHLDRVAALLERLPQGLFLAGSGYSGVGIPDCIRQGQETAAAALAHIRNHAARLELDEIAAVAK